MHEVISDRAFWLGDDQNRILAVVHEEPSDRVIDIDAGQWLHFRAVALAPRAADELPGKLEPDARRAIARSQFFLAMHWRDVRVFVPPAGETPP